MRWYDPFPALMLGAVLSGCVANAPRTHAPPATEAQVDKERQYLQKHFFTDDCMARLRKSAPRTPWSSPKYSMCSRAVSRGYSPD